MIRMLLLVMAMLSYAQQINGQEKKFELLWEISGGDLKGNSYVFGSMHLNDSRIFEFGDSLYYCISKCQHFNNEINFDSLNYLMAQFDMKELISDSANQGESEKIKNTDYNDINGFFTVLDLQLFNTAKSLNLSVGGLEKMVDQMDIFEEIKNSEEDIEYGDPYYEQYIELYEKGSIVSMDSVFNTDDNENDIDMYDMINRNTKQVQSIIKSGQTQPTFNVVGAAHLFGENNVLDNLKTKATKSEK